MIHSVYGVLTEKMPDTAVLQTGHFALDISVSLNTSANLPETGTEIRLYTYLHVREDILQLYGFLKKEEKDLFLRLISLTGIGPKNAMTMLSGVTPADFRKSIATGDVKALTKIPGIGDKKARRIIIELKDKLSDDELARMTDSGTSVIRAHEQLNEALSALDSLGFRKSEVSRFAEEFVDGNPDASADAIIRYVLSRGKR